MKTLEQHWLSDLKVGDEVAWRDSRSGFLSRAEATIKFGKVEHATATQVVVGGVRYSRKFGRPVGDRHYSAPSLEIPTPELRERAARQRVNARALNAIERLRVSPSNGGVGGESREWTHDEAMALRAMAVAANSAEFTRWLDLQWKRARLDAFVEIATTLAGDDSTGRRTTLRGIESEIRELRRVLGLPEVAR